MKLCRAKYCIISNETVSNINPTHCISITSVVGTELTKLLQKVKMSQVNVSGEEVEDNGDVVDPWNVASKSEAGIDYEKLIRKSQ